MFTLFGPYWRKINYTTRWDVEGFFCVCFSADWRQCVYTVSYVHLAVFLKKALSAGGVGQPVGLDEQQGRLPLSVGLFCTRNLCCAEGAF